MPPPSPPGWQLPTGVSRGLWDYLHDPSVARNYDASLTDSPLFQADEAFVLRHAQRLSTASPPRLLDLGCGTGRLLLRLAQQGWWCLGVDLSEEMLAVARQRTAQVQANVALLRANLTELDLLTSQSFDLAACLFSTLGMVTGLQARRQVVAHAFRLLRPGGIWILHVHNLYWHLRHREGRRWLLGNLIRSLLGDPHAGDRLMPPHHGIGALPLHLFTRREVTRLVRSAGFRLLEVLPLGLGSTGQLTRPRVAAAWRAYGWLLAAQRP